MQKQEQQTAVEWLIDNLKGQLNIDEVTYIIKKGKEMEKKQIIEAINNVSENNVKYANMIVSSWSQIEEELFMHNTKVAEQYYEQTYGSNK
jgi:hypothetical protein